MDIPETPEPEIYEENIKNQNDANNRNKYELTLNNDIYTLLIETLSKENILFNLRQTNFISYTYYSKKYKYNDLLKLLNLSDKNYGNINSILELFDTSILNKKVKIDFDKYNKNIILYIKIKEDSEEKEKYIYLEKGSMSIKEMQGIIIDEINEIKNNKKINNMNNDNEGDMIQKYENKIKEIDKQINEKNIEKIELQQKIALLKNKINMNEKNKYLENNGIKEKKNEINFVLKIEKKDIGEEIEILGKERSEEICESNVDLYINKVKNDFCESFDFPKEGFYYFKLKFKNPIKSCEKMFYEISNLISVDLSNFDSSNVINMNEMFSGCENLINIDLSSFKSKNLKYMNEMFSGCENLIAIDLSSFDSKNIKNMEGAFEFCEKLINIDLSSFNTENLDNISDIFNGCINLENIDLTSFDFNKINNKKNIFGKCFNLKTIRINKNSLKYLDKIVSKELIEIIN